MKFDIIADSGCDLTPQLENELKATTIPLSMILESKEYVDDEFLDMPEFMAHMKTCTDKVSSASPPPGLYQEAFAKSKQAFAVTLSSQLSGSYANANIGKAMAEENGADIHIFDSKSASAGQLLIVMKIRELLDTGIDRATVVNKINEFIDNMKTYFVLERYDNLEKNGRLNKITGKLIRVLNIKLIMGADGNGNIALFAKPRGVQQMLDKMVSLIGESDKSTEAERLIISHNNNPTLAQRLYDEVGKRYSFKEIWIVPTKGLASLYTDDGGIVMAF